MSKRKQLISLHGLTIRLFCIDDNGNNLIKDSIIEFLETWGMVKESVIRDRVYLLHPFGRKEEIANGLVKYLAERLELHILEPREFDSVVSEANNE